MEFSCKSERTLGCGILWQFQKPFQKFSKIFILFRISKKTFPLLSKIFNLSAMDYSGIASKYSPLIFWPKFPKYNSKHCNMLSQKAKSRKTFRLSNSNWFYSKAMLCATPKSANLAWVPFWFTTKNLKNCQTCTT